MDALPHLGRRRFNPRSASPYVVLYLTRTSDLRPQTSTLTTGTVAATLRPWTPEPSPLQIPTNPGPTTVSIIAQYYHHYYTYCRDLPMSLASGPGRAGVANMPAEMRLYVDKHVSYIQSLDTVRLSALRRPSRQLSLLILILTASAAQGRARVLAHRASSPKWALLGPDCAASARPCRCPATPGNSRICLLVPA